MTILFVFALIMPMPPTEAMAGLNDMDRTPPNGDPSRSDVLVRCTSAPPVIALQFGYGTVFGPPPDPFPKPTGEPLHRELLE